MVNCRPTPAAVPTPAWLPADLPLPPGTFATAELQTTPTGQAMFASPAGGLVAFVKFVTAEWPKHGWTQGRGEAEQAEAENSFLRPSATAAGGREGGAWRAREPFCQQGLVEVLIVFKR